MHLDRPTLDQRLAGLASLGLLTEREASDVRMTLAPEFAFRAAMTHAESVHLHIRVDDVERTRAALARLVGTPENEKSGYVKYRSPDGLHVIVWSIDVAEDDRISSLRRRARPHLDHLGIDVREDSPDTRAVFDAIPALAAASSWRHARQGGGGTAVHCCHTSVAEKHWAYPPSWASVALTIEVAFGPLMIGDGSGCDLRPLDPALAAAHVAAPECCASPAPLTSLGEKPRPARP